MALRVRASQGRPHGVACRPCAHTPTRVRAPYRTGRWPLRCAASPGSGSSDEDQALAREFRNAAVAFERRAEGRRMELAVLMDSLDGSARRRIAAEQLHRQRVLSPFEREWREPNRWEREEQARAVQALAGVWRRRGLTNAAAQGLADWMVRVRSPYALDLHLLRAKVERLQRALPRPLSAAHALAACPTLLHAETAGVVAVCVALAGTFTPRQLPMLLKAEPRLLTLTAEEVEERLGESRTALAALFGGATDGELVKALAKFPVLLFLLPALDHGALREARRATIHEGLQIYQLATYLQQQQRPQPQLR